MELKYVHDVLAALQHKILLIEPYGIEISQKHAAYIYNFRF